VSHGVPPLGGGVSPCQTREFLSLSLNISKTVADTAKVAIND